MPLCPLAKDHRHFAKNAGIKIDDLLAIPDFIWIFADSLICRFNELTNRHVNHSKINSRSSDLCAGRSERHISTRVLKLNGATIESLQEGLKIVVVLSNSLERSPRSLEQRLHRDLCREPA